MEPPEGIDNHLQFIAGQVVHNKHACQSTTKEVYMTGQDTLVKCYNWLLQASAIIVHVAH